MILKLCVLLITLTIYSANPVNQNGTESVLEVPNKNETFWWKTVQDVDLESDPFEVITFETEMPEIVTTPVPNEADILHNTFEFNGKKYLFNTESKTDRVRASLYCVRKSMFLTSINSAEENDWIASKIVELGFGNDDFLIGGVDYTGVFTWNYFFHIKFTNWADSEPRRDSFPLRNNANCILLTASTGFKWSSRRCLHNPNYFICKEKSLQF